jgi:hypothetical protein
MHLESSNEFFHSAFAFTHTQKIIGKRITKRDARTEGEQEKNCFCGNLLVSYSLHLCMR